MRPKRRITVLLADDHDGIRKELRKILEAAGDIEVVGEASNGEQAVEMAMKLRPAMVVMDIAMPKLNGLDATHQILQELPTAKVLVCSAYRDEVYVERAMAAGATGYISKLSIDLLTAALRGVHEGNAFIDPALPKRHPHKPYDKRAGNR